MNGKFLLILPLALALGASTAEAKDFWDAPFTQWSSKQVLQIINKSPWAQDQTFAAGLERDLDANIGAAGVGVAGDREIFHKLTVRFFSARPIREAYVRMFQIANNYDQATPEQQKAFDERFKRALALDVSNRVIIALEFATNQPQVSREMKQFLEIARMETLKQSVYLISQRLGRVELAEYYPPSPDGTGAKFIFPREVKGTPVVSPEDKEVRFEFYVAPISQKLFLKFDVRKMRYKNELSY